jgi:hypothetical protein
MFNEATILIVLHNVMAFINPYHHIDIKAKLGWSLIFLSITNMMANLIIVLMSSSIDMFNAGNKTYIENKNEADIKERLYNDDLIAEDSSHYDVKLMREEYEAYIYSKEWIPHRQWCVKNNIENLSSFKEEIEY